MGLFKHMALAGLSIATFIAGILLIGMGLARLGSVIKFIPYPLIVGFTSGIAVVIFSSQVKDLLGLQMGLVPADFSQKWLTYFRYFPTMSVYALLLSLGTIAVILLWPRVTSKVPGSLVAVLVTTILVAILHLPVETVGSRFGTIQSTFPHPFVPRLDFLTIKTLIQPAFTIALLGGIESLLSAVVADGMIGGNHRSNMELVAQGLANICSSLFGGIPATGAIARTATNVKNGGRTPIAGMTHAVTLLLILLFFGRWAARIPMATLAGILVVVSYNMSEWRSFLSILKGSANDIAILLTTFLLTVIIDLTIAIEVGMILAAFLFMRSMIRSSSVSSLRADDGNEEQGDLALGENYPIPRGVEVFEVEGPLFFGAAYKFQDAIRMMDRGSRVLIIRLRKVPIIDATGIRVIKAVVKDSARRGTRLILAELEPRVLKDLTDARLIFAVGKANIADNLMEAIERAKVVLAS
jgi:SulP family sulfate permease